MKLIAVKSFCTQRSKVNIEKKLLSLVKRILIVNISNARNIFIRIPLKICIIVLALTIKFIFGTIFNFNDKKNDLSVATVKIQPSTPVKRIDPQKSDRKPTEQSSPSSISVILSYDDHTMSTYRKSLSSKFDYTTRNSLYSVIKSNSQSSLVNFFTPDYDIDSIGISDINSFKASTNSFLSKKEEDIMNLNETELDCDSLGSSFYYDLKTHFSTIDCKSKFSEEGDHYEKNKLNNSGLPDLINQKGNKEVPTDKARKYLEGLDGVKFNEIQVPDTLKKQLEYFDRDELLQLIAYQKKYLDFKETRIKDLENYIDNLVVKIIETEPLILMNASNVLTKSKNVI